MGSITLSLQSLPKMDDDDALLAKLMSLEDAEVRPLDMHAPRMCQNAAYARRDLWTGLGLPNIFECRMPNIIGVRIDAGL